MSGPGREVAWLKTRGPGWQQVVSHNLALYFIPDPNPMPVFKLWRWWPT